MRAFILNILTINLMLVLFGVTFVLSFFVGLLFTYVTNIVLAKVSIMNYPS